MTSAGACGPARAARSTSRRARPLALLLALALALLPLPACRGAARADEPLLDRIASELRLTEGAVRFAVIGDAGTGGRAQYEVAGRLAEAHRRFPFEFVLMLGDNLYGLERPSDYARKFEQPYAPLLEQGVTFHAALGNHDNVSQRLYEPFHMGGERYHHFRKGNARFFALDSNYVDPAQLAWLERELAAADEPWKICFFHHPLYSSGDRHGPSLELRRVLEPILVRHGVRVVFAGHEHFYERIAPQHGVHHFISGAAGKLLRGDIRKSGITVRGFDRDYSFMLVEIDGDALRFEAVARSGTIVDAGVIPVREEERQDRDAEMASGGGAPAGAPGAAAR